MGAAWLPDGSGFHIQPKAGHGKDKPTIMPTEEQADIRAFPTQVLDMHVHPG